MSELISDEFAGVHRRQFYKKSAKLQKRGHITRIAGKPHDVRLFGSVFSGVRVGTTISEPQARKVLSGVNEVVVYDVQTLPRPGHQSFELVPTGASSRNVYVESVSIKTRNSVIGQMISPIKASFHQSISLNQENYRLKEESKTLKETTESLTAEVKKLRVLLAKMASRGPSAPELPDASVADNRAAAAEMLADLDTAEAETIFEVLGADSYSVVHMAERLGLTKTTHIVSLLANCRAATAYGESIVPTQFGRALFKWLMAQSAQ